MIESVERRLAPTVPLVQGHGYIEDSTVPTVLTTRQEDGSNLVSAVIATEPSTTESLWKVFRLFTMACVVLATACSVLGHALESLQGSSRGTN